MESGHLLVCVRYSSFRGCGYHRCHLVFYRLSVLTEYKHRNFLQSSSLIKMTMDNVLTSKSETLLDVFRFNLKFMFLNFWCKKISAHIAPWYTQQLHCPRDFPLRKRDLVVNFERYAPLAKSHFFRKCCLCPKFFDNFSRKAPVIIFHFDHPHMRFSFLNNLIIVQFLELVNRFP